MVATPLSHTLQATCGTLQIRRKLTSCSHSPSRVQHPPILIPSI